MDMGFVVTIQLNIKLHNECNNCARIPVIGSSRQQARVRLDTGTTYVRDAGVEVI